MVYRLSWTTSCFLGLCYLFASHVMLYTSVSPEAKTFASARNHNAYSQDVTSWATTNPTRQILPRRMLATFETNQILVSHLIASIPRDRRRWTLPVCTRQHLQSKWKSEVSTLWLRSKEEAEKSNICISEGLPVIQLQCRPIISYSRENVLEQIE